LLRKLRDRLGVQEADLALGSTGVPVAFEPKIGHQPRFGARQLPELFIRVGIYRDQTRHTTSKW
jgi:hypothetical protein